MKLNLLNKTFGRLTVISFSGKKNNGRNLLWNCKCSCGNTAIVSGSKLKSLHTKSCGCLVPERLRNRNDNWETSAQNLLYSQYKSRAKSREIEFNIEKTYFNSIVLMNCYYCGSGLSCSVKYGNHNYKYNSIDRIDSSKGYISGNVLPCCHICNTMKLDLPQNEFYHHIKKIVLERGL